MEYSAAEQNKVIEKQLAYLVQLVNVLFSYGMPSSSALERSPAPYQESIRPDVVMGQLGNQTSTEKYLDFKIIEQVIKLCKITNGWIRGY